jgi:hypothetical protein
MSVVVLLFVTCQSQNSAYPHTLSDYSVMLFFGSRLFVVMVFDVVTVVVWVLAE